MQGKLIEQIQRQAMGNLFTQMNLTNCSIDVAYIGTNNIHVMRRNHPDPILMVKYESPILN